VNDQEYRLRSIIWGGSCQAFRQTERQYFPDSTLPWDNLVMSLSGIVEQMIAGGPLRHYGRQVMGCVFRCQRRRGRGRRIYEESIWMSSLAVIAKGEGNHSKTLI